MDKRYTSAHQSIITSWRSLNLEETANSRRIPQTLIGVMPEILIRFIIPVKVGT